MKEVNEFFLKNKVFTTSAARQAGFGKAALTSMKAVTNLGTFPRKYSDGVRYESLWTYDEEVSDLRRTIKRLGRSRTPNMPQLLSIRDRLEVIMREKLDVTVNINPGTKDESHTNSDTTVVGTNSNTLENSNG